MASPQPRKRAISSVISIVPHIRSTCRATASKLWNGRLRRMNTNCHKRTKNNYPQNTLKIIINKGRYGGMLGNGYTTQASVRKKPVILMRFNWLFRIPFAKVLSNYAMVLRS